MHSLRTKITMLTVWLTIFAVAAVTLLSVIVIRKTERTESEQLLLLMCETGQRNLDYYFNTRSPGRPTGFTPTTTGLTRRCRKRKRASGTRTWTVPDSWSTK